MCGTYLGTAERAYHMLGRGGRDLCFLRRLPRRQGSSLLLSFWTGRDWAALIFQIARPALTETRNPYLFRLLVSFSSDCPSDATATLTTPRPPGALGWSARTHARLSTPQRLIDVATSHRPGTARAWRAPLADTHSRCLLGWLGSSENKGTDCTNMRFPFMPRTLAD